MIIPTWFPVGMAMYHANHPDGNYQMANRVQVFDPPRAISWEPGQDTGDGRLRFGGWVWRYDLTPAGPSETKVTLSYDWSAVPGFLRQHIGFPPFPPDHRATRCPTSPAWPPRDRIAGPQGPSPALWPGQAGPMTRPRKEGEAIRGRNACERRRFARNEKPTQGRRDP
jgi:hypothetical protein